MKSFKPELLLSLKSYSKEQLVKDLIAGLIVAIIALPLSIALALASGVNPEQGLYTAIIAGFLISAFGGSKVQISGPTAAFATIVAGIVAVNGLSGLAVATIMAGIILVLMGVFKLGSLIRFIPYTITTGFTSGIAVTIVIGQLKDFFGITYAEGTVAVETMEKAEALFANFSSFNPYALLVGGICLAILILWPYASKKIPGSLVAIIVSVLLVKLAKLPVNTIGDLYTISSSLPKFTAPDLSLSTIGALLPDAFTIAILAAIESLLSCVVADGMIGAKHNSNMELVAQGIGNIGSALFGGIPATGAIARTAANIKNGGRTPVVGIVHAIVLLLVLVVLMPYAALIPMPAIAAILLMVAYNMSEWRHFLHIVKTAPKSDVLVLVLTFLLTVIFDLVVAIEVGLVLACVLFMKRMSDTTKLRKWEEHGDHSEYRDIPENTAVYELSGPMFFGAADEILKISVKSDRSCIVLRMKGVSAIDSTGLKNLERIFAECKEKGITLILSHLNEQPMKSLEKAGLLKELGEENICPNIDAALARAAALNK
ncbi:MAG: sulfate permease [Clostridia bacterium]|nr:sulfate permease [Clostridia bacterium]